jgi:hypothetical protein
MTNVGYGGFSILKWSEVKYTPAFSKKGYLRRRTKQRPQAGQKLFSKKRFSNLLT